MRLRKLFPTVRVAGKKGRGASSSICAPATDSPPPRADHGGSLLRLCTGCGRQYPIRNRAPRTYVRHTLKSFLHRMHTTCQTWELLSVPARHSPSCGRPVKTYIARLRRAEPEGHSYRSFSRGALSLLPFDPTVRLRRWRPDAAGPGLYPRSGLHR